MPTPSTLSAFLAHGASDPDFFRARLPKLHEPAAHASASRARRTIPVRLTSGLGETGSPLPLWKRTLDVTGALFALPVLAVCALGMLILTRLYSPGPVLFRQERVGYMGRRFTLYKFRTMHTGADSRVHQSHVHDLIRSNAPMEKLDSRGDTRLIPFTWLLRATGLDELPQLLNVLRGDMSLVGPRPCLPSEFAQFVSWQRQRCDAVPGLTGLWQVSGKNRLTFEQMLRLDVQYARSVSLRLDASILLRTLPAVFSQVRDIRRARKQRPTHPVQPEVNGTWVLNDGSTSASPQ